MPADDWVLNRVSAHIERYGPGPDGVIITNRVGKVARRNSFGFCWRHALTDARTCGKPPATPKPEGECDETTCADPAHCLPKGTRFHDLRHFYASTLIAANLNPKVNPGPARPRLDHRDDGHLLPDAEDLGRGVIDAVLSRNAALAKNPAEPERNQQAS